MELNLSRKWYENKKDAEKDCDVTAGVPVGARDQGSQIDSLELKTIRSRAEELTLQALASGIVLNWAISSAEAGDSTEPAHKAENAASHNSSLAAGNAESFGAWLVRENFLTKDEYLRLTWRAVEALEGSTSHEGFLDPAFQECPDRKDLLKLRPLPFGDILNKETSIFNNVLARSSTADLDQLVSRWQLWHVENIQPISSYALGTSGHRSFGRRLYENEMEKVNVAEFVVQNIVHDSDCVIIPEGTSSFWVGLAALKHRRNLSIITSNGALVRELLENPKLRESTSDVIVVGGMMDVDEREGGSSSYGFLGRIADRNYEQLFDDPNATVLISSVNGLLPEQGPFAPPCPPARNTRYCLLNMAFTSGIRNVVFVSDYTKMRYDRELEFGDPIYNKPQEWQSLLQDHGKRIAIVAAPPPDLQNHPELLIERPLQRPTMGPLYSKALTEYLKVAAGFDRLLTSHNVSTGFIEVGIPGLNSAPITT